MTETLRGLGVAFRKVDVDEDPAPRERFGLRIPVLARQDGTEICEGHVEPQALRRRLGLE